MAILSTFQSKFGIETAYAKITHYTQSAQKIYVALSLYLSKDNRDAGDKPIETRQYLIPMYTPDFINQSGMNHLKYSYIKLIEAYGFIGDEDISQYLSPVTETTEPDPDPNIDMDPAE